MSYTLDFKAIAATPIADVAKLLGFSLTEKNDQLVGQCPISQLTNPTAFKITPAMNRFICFCTEYKKLPKQGGDVIEMVRRFRRFAGPRDAAVEIQKLCGAGKLDDNAGQQQEVADRPKSSAFDPLSYLATLDAAHDALKDIDIMPETLISFKAGYCSKGLNRGRLAVGWHDMSGQVRMFIGVALDATIPRYTAPKGQEMPYFFNAHTIDADSGEELRILPHVFDVMRAIENGATNVICPLRPVDNLSLACLTALVKDKKVTVEF